MDNAPARIYWPCTTPSKEGYIIGWVQGDNVAVISAVVHGISVGGGGVNLGLFWIFN
mgnify:CR=1 FL=1